MSHFETFGDPAAPTLLLLHGAGSTMLAWEDEFCRRLAAGVRHVVRMDNRSASLRGMAADTVALLDELGVERAHYVGMSLGGAIAQLAALDHAERVATITLLSSMPGGPGHDAPDLPVGSEELFSEELPEPDWSDRAAVVTYLVEAERPFSPTGFDEEATRRVMERVVDRYPDLAQMLELAFSSEAGEPWRERLGTISVPTLIVHGADDPLFGPAHGEALAREIPGAELLLLDGVGHEYPPARTWDVVIRALLEHTAR